MLKTLTILLITCFIALNAAIAVEEPAFELIVVKEDIPIKLKEPFFSFNFSNPQVDLKRVYNSGLLPDEIPALVNPKFKPASNIEYYLQPTIIIGLEVNGEVKGYPINILNWHGGANDVVGGRHVFISWDPLSGSILAFSRMIKGEKNKFGVSGMVYKSSVVYYDEITKSLWSPMAKKAITGEHAGEKLDIIPTFITNWSDFKQTFPKAEVLTDDIGLGLNYKAKPYADYATNKELIFPVNYYSDTLPRKEMVLGVELVKGNDVKHIAFPVDH